RRARRARGARRAARRRRDERVVLRVIVVVRLPDHLHAPRVRRDLDRLDRAPDGRPSNPPLASARTDHGSLTAGQPGRARRAGRGAGRAGRRKLRVKEVGWRSVASGAPVDGTITGVRKPPGLIELNRLKTSAFTSTRARAPTENIFAKRTVNRCSGMPRPQLT